jgi:regulator of protease activity HflC (stomatin/prohibitin superfamily)
LEFIVTGAKRLPMSRKLLMDPDQLMELVDQLRVTVPKDVADADEVLRKRDELLNQSLGEARRIRASAETEFRDRIDENELVHGAEKQAEQLVQEAQQKAQHILDIADNDAASRRSSADEYAQEALYKLEQDVAGILSTVRNGIELLDSRQNTAAAV